MSNKSYLAIFLSLFLLTNSFAEKDEGVQIDPSFFTAIQLGQIVDGKYRNHDMTDISWLKNSVVNFGMSSVFNENLKVIASLEAATWFSTHPMTEVTDPYVLPAQFTALSIHQAEGVYMFGDPEAPMLEIGVGIFPYKYNSDVKNLGEYMYRSGTYPGYLMSEFGFNFSRVTGLRLKHSFDGIWNNELILSSRSEMPPLHDLDLTYITDVNIGEFLTLGFGFQWTHMIPATDTLTTPKNNKNAYYESGLLNNVDPENIPAPGTYLALDDTMSCLVRNGYVLLTGHDSLGLADGYYCADKRAPVVGRALNTPDSLNIQQVDLDYYTYEGFKLMGRFALDPKVFFENDLFGPLDFRLYGEFSVLGLEDYPIYYEKLSERIPVMFGFNFPAFNLLDYLSIEVEWYGYQYANQLKQNFKQTGGQENSATPWESQYGNCLQESDACHDYDTDNWKWSIQARKTITDGFMITAMAARDHLRHQYQNEYTEDRETLLLKNSQWYWMVQLLFGI
ncbi:MAG: hypothetical protein HQK83_02605 [Fibrobacteria bacterium]|nr:hypothetical protein [Fibrobacteria bacterium]